MTRVTIKLTGGRYFEVDAHVFGEWAAHPSADIGDVLRDDWWSVTHLPNGRRIRSAGQIDEQQAIALASALSRRSVGLPVYTGPSECVGYAELVGFDRSYESAARIVRSVVFDILGRVHEG